jgi:streptomycin 6-kinase
MPAALDEGLEDLGRGVEHAAAQRYPGCALEALTVLPGGHSGLTHVATLVSANGALRVVVKSTPPGRPARGRHDVLRQARILRALGRWGHVPIPEVLFWSQSPVALVGIELVEGFAAEPVMEEPRSDEHGAAVAAAWRAAVDLLVSLQEAHAEDLDLADEPVVSPLDELDRWRATMRAAGLDDSDARAPELARRLASAQPVPWRPCLVHGDFRLGNMLQNAGEISALVDWEIWSVGDPRSDLGWLTLFTDESNFPDFGRAVPGTPRADDVVERYLAGAAATNTGVEWFRALACFKLAAIQAHNLRRHRDGRYHDPHQERLVASTGALLDQGLRLLGATSAQSRP